VKPKSLNFTHRIREKRMGFLRQEKLVFWNFSFCCDIRIIQRLLLPKFSSGSHTSLNAKSLNKINGRQLLKEGNWRFRTPWDMTTTRV
jgi:hypothetical protein